MKKIEITNIPNQEISVVLDENNYDIRFHTCEDNKSIGAGIVAVDIIRNNEVIVQGFRCTPETMLIPYYYLSDGNFIIITQNDEYPNWRLFGVNQFLYYLSQEEIDEILDNG